MSDAPQIFTIFVEGLDSEPPKLPVHIVRGDADRASRLCDSLKVRFRMLAFSFERWSASDLASPPAAAVMVDDARKGVFGEEAALVCDAAYRIWEFMEASRRSGESRSDPLPGGENGGKLEGPGEPPPPDAVEVPKEKAPSAPPVLTIATWEELGIGIDEDGSYLAVTPCPAYGAVFPKEKATRLDLRGDRWKHLLDLPAKSKDGNSAKKQDVMIALRYLQAGRFARDELEELKGNGQANDMADSIITTPVLLTVADLAELLNTSPRSIYRLNSERKLPAALRLGQQPRWRRAEIEAWIQAGMPSRSEWEKAKGQGAEK